MARKRSEFFEIFRLSRLRRRKSFFVQFFERFCELENNVVPLLVGAYDCCAAVPTKMTNKNWI